jgi:hypothetical protein
MYIQTYDDCVIVYNILSVIQGKIRMGMETEVK